MCHHILSISSIIYIYIYQPYDVHHKPRLNMNTEKLRPPAFHEAGNVGVTLAIEGSHGNPSVKSWENDRYPLVNIEKAIENGHLQWIYP